MKTSGFIRTILIATDFSANARVAVRWAEEIARHHAARLVLVHAMAPNTPAAPEFVPMPPSYYDAMRTASVQHLELDAERLRSAGLAVEAEMVEGTAVKSLLAAVERYGADLLVAGTRGRTGWKRLLLGSTAARLVQSARCPVLTVHRTDAGPPRPFRTVLAAIDFSADAESAARTAIRALPASEARLVLLHCLREQIEPAEDHPPVPAEAIHVAEKAAQERIDALKDALARPGVAIEARVCRGHPVEVILSATAESKADLVAMGTHGRSGLDRWLLGSVTERVLPLAPCPVLTVAASVRDGS